MESGRTRRGLHQLPLDGDDVAGVRLEVRCRPVVVRIVHCVVRRDLVAAVATV